MYYIDGYFCMTSCPSGDILIHELVTLLLLCKCRRNDTANRASAGKKSKTAKKNKGKKSTNKADNKSIKTGENDRGGAQATSTSMKELKEASAAANRFTRNRDADGKQAKKAGALAKLREEKAKVVAIRKDGSDESELDYGSDEDSDEDYDEGGASKKRWGASAGQKNKASTSRGRSSRMDDFSSSEDEAEREEYVEADVDDFRKVTVSRHRLSLWCNEPYFADIVIGAYVRVSIGMDKSSDKPCYRLCKIEGVESRNEYKFPKSRDGKQVRIVKFVYLCS